MTDARAAIEVRALTKSFRGRRRFPNVFARPKPIEALRGVDLSVHRGELVALLGPNGAGKTTLLKILATLVLPTSGSALVEGLDLNRDAERARARIGYVLTDERSFYWRISVRENLRFFGTLQGLSGRALASRVAELAGLLGLSEHLDRDFADLSSGQKQRVAIARGLIADPPVLLFDEATRSLDPGRAEQVRRVIREMLVVRGDKAVLFATHDLDEARELADRVVVMAEGQVACEGRFPAIEPEVMTLFRAEAEREEAELLRLFPDLAVPRARR